MLMSFCEKDLIVKFNKVYFFFSSVAGCLIFSVVNLCLYIIDSYEVCDRLK